jgi:hypothetical protein
VLARQTLLGGDYELVDRGTFHPNPTYWMAFLWPRLMSAHALNLTVAPATASGSSNTVNTTKVLRAYAHCGLLLGGVTLALINISPNETLSIDVKGLQAEPSDQPRQEYHLSGSSSGSGGNGRDNLASRIVHMRGKPVTAASFADPLSVPVGRPTQLAPLTVAFVGFPDACAVVCLGIG